MPKTPKPQASERTQSTSGPWKACLNVELATIPGHVIKQDDAIERPICLVPEGGGLNGKPIQIANAVLIAAAPDLYSALEALTLAAMNMPFGKGELLSPIMQSRAALAKAKGAQA